MRVASGGETISQHAMTGERPQKRIVSKPPSTLAQQKLIIRVAALRALFACQHKARLAARGSYHTPFDFDYLAELFERWGLLGRIWVHLYAQHFHRHRRRKLALTRRLNSRPEEARIGAWIGQRLAGWTWSEVAERAGRGDQEDEIKRECLWWAPHIGVVEYRPRTPLTN